MFNSHSRLHMIIAAGAALAVGYVNSVITEINGVKLASKKARRAMKTVLHFTGNTSATNKSIADNNASAEVVLHNRFNFSDQIKVAISKIRAGKEFKRGKTNGSGNSVTFGVTSVMAT